MNTGVNVNKLLFGKGTKLIIGTSKKTNKFFTFNNYVMKVNGFEPDK